ncbi:MAG: DNA polymerase III subunit gamma/tau [Burkholderiaceae bacterium]|nr:MAG: DNA polymerase III subunit gamma/tau [Burkholderiaceae bacterium]
MSYQVLARKWRPKNFATLVEQEHVVRALTHALDQNRLHHAYLFTGTRGVGKTTLARILAKALNCETGITSKPCGVCRACTEIDQGRFVDLIEVDAATNTKVEEMRQLLENAVYAPTSGRFKVYVIDEVHMLSSSAFNAMLKTLEEPPEHIKFILATTDPQKIPVTVLSRCLQFNLKQMPPSAIVEHLQHILGVEKVACELPALRLIAHAASGSMRDALSLLDQAIAYSAGPVTEAAVRGMLGAIDRSTIVRLLDALAARDGKTLLAIADEMTARSLSFTRALSDMGALLHRMALAQQVPDALLEDDPDTPEVKRLATLFDAEEIQLYYQICLHGRNEMGLAPDEYAGFTMTLLRLLAFQPASSNDAPAKASTPRAMPLVSSKPAMSATVVAQTAAPYAAPAMVTTLATPAPAALDFNGDWPALTSRVAASGMAKQFLQQSEFVRLDGITFHVRVPLKPLAEPGTVEKARTALRNHFNVNVNLMAEVGAVAGVTAAKVEQAQQTDRMNQATQAIQSDAFVNDLISQFDATVVPGSIKPI